MSLNISVPEKEKGLLRPRITVFGIGGAGGNAVGNMIASGLEGVEFVVANTDAQALDHNYAERRIQIGADITSGLGAGSRPDVGRAAAEESIEDLVDALQGSHMVFVTAGMGGGTGTGAAPVLARISREQEILTIGVVTKPFNFEGPRRMAVADEGIAELQRHVDTLLVIPNQNLFRVASETTSFAQAFALADRVLYSAVSGITNLMVKPGVINLDFADVRTVMNEMGKAMMGTGEAHGPGRALEAAEAAIANPLLDDVSMRGARGVLISITGGSDLTLFEIDEAANRIRSEVDADANIIVGTACDAALEEGLMRVSIVATGIEAEEERMGLPSVDSAPALRVVGEDDVHASARGADTVVHHAEMPQSVAAVGHGAMAVGDESGEMMALQVAHGAHGAHVGHGAHGGHGVYDAHGGGVAHGAHAPVYERGGGAPAIEATAFEATALRAPVAGAGGVGAVAGEPSRGKKRGLLRRMFGGGGGKSAPGVGVEVRHPKLELRQPASADEQLEIPAFLRR